MHRFYCPSAPASGGEITLDEGESRHARTVLRLKVDDRVEVLDGAGWRLLCSVLSSGRQPVQLRVLDRTFLPETQPRITLYQSVLKGKAMEWLMQKAAELGVNRIVPLITERVVIRWDTAEAERRRTKWEWICCEALKQCGGVWLPRVERPVRVAECLERPEQDSLQLVGSLQEDAPSMQRHFDGRRGRDLNEAPGNVALWIGPEGDFTLTELELLRAAGVCPTTFGPRVLRAETAALYGVAVIRHELDRASSGR